MIAAPPPPIPLSSVSGLGWPGIPAPGGATLLAVLQQLEHSQWWSPPSLRAAQHLQLGAVCEHAWQALPFHRERLDAAGWRPGLGFSDEVLQRLPVLTRAELQQSFHALQCAPPASHGVTREGRSSGSTGTPVRFVGTELTRFMWDAITLRDHLWQRRDFSRKLVAVRPHAQDRSLPGWGKPVQGVFATGPSVSLSVSEDIERLWQRVREERPGYLLSLPSVIETFARLSRERGEPLPGLMEVRTYGEVLEPRVRALCREAWGVPVVDLYSCQEAGYLALQCPEQERYHVQSECLLVEILDDQGRACAPGQIGRVVVTTLHNFAMPLLRYDVGDYAEVGEPCPCGRGLPVLNRIMGRARNLLRLPDGTRRWPFMGTVRVNEVAPVRSMQVVQKSLQRIEIRLVVMRALDAGEAEAVRRLVTDALGHPFEAELTFWRELPRSASGKFEDFLSEIRD